ncbi:protein KRI1 homolog [Uloborus diversus]|uniref:protein KRI1 homolog n=1 Tax=Uloborus diversus TaxID=327109 RepID=UPI0024093514|nr:protein KRI1 homolog [Uloborus diversus]XP_054717999.1 protein KRI1 homolog [Uloborus diversus]XP_054718000.1 protein KRI1 homolog [Uloborus diversus]XP_054718001.1 protein KRI1 homolog [Uloborus diversus]
MSDEKVTLLSDSSDSEVDFSINKSYADRYDSWRNKEELQKLKDLSKDVSETSSSSEEEAEPEIEEDFLKTLSLLKSKDPKIYDTNVQFFKEQTVEKKSKEHKPKPMFMKDYERKLVLERNGEFSDEDEQVNEPRTYGEEQDEIKQSFKAALDNSDDEDDLLQARQKTDEEKNAEEAEYLRWLKGQEEKVPEDTEKEMSFLRKYWNDPKLDEGEKFLKDFILNKKYIVKDNEGEIPTYDEITGDVEMLQEDEKILEQQEMFEHKYNFRFEEPDDEFIKRYPRTIGDSLRRVDSRRKVKRDEYAERKKKEKEQKREELKRLKALKRKEIEEKFMKLKEICGQDELNLDENDIESDFDPDKHDQKMKELFNDDYYKVEEEDKPQFSYDEELDEENWNTWCRENAVKNEEEDTDQEEDKLDDKSINNVYNDAKDEFEKEMIESTQNRKKKKKKSLFAKVISEPKPLYDPDGKSFEDYLDEYYKLDYEDIIGDQPVRYKYRKVVPNDFGLTVEEILSANDKELNRWCSVKKTCQYRDEEEELYDVQAFKKKSQNEFSKKKVFQSLYGEKNENATKSETGTISENASTSKKKRKRKSKGKKEDEAVENATNNDGIDNKMSEGNRLMEDQNEFSAKKILQSTNPEKDENATKSETGTISANASSSNRKRKRKSKGKNEGDSFENATNNDEIGNEMSEENHFIEDQKSKERIMSESKSKKQGQEIDVSRTEEENTETSETKVSNSETNVSGTPSKKSRKRKRKKSNVSESTEADSTEHIHVSKHQKVESESDKSVENITVKKSETDIAETTGSQSNICSVTGELNANQATNSSSPNKQKKKKKKKKGKLNDSNAQINKNTNEPGAKSMNSARHSFPHKKSEFKQNVSDKRLQMSDARLAAYGINPKKFKNHIIYSQK